MTSSIQYQNSVEVLTRKLSELEQRLAEGKRNLVKLEREMATEKADVERLENDSFTTSLLKLLGRHEGKLSQEQEAYLKAKLSYEQQVYELSEMEGQLTNLNQRLEETTNEMIVYQKSLTEKLSAFDSLPEGAPERAVFEKLTLKEQALKARCTELEEAISACTGAMTTKDEALKLLESAESWATWDAWAGGGLLTDMVKYEKLDAVQVVFKKLQSDMNILKREMADVDVQINFELSQIDATTKMFDIWFDNFFTDMKVKTQILAQIEALKVLSKELTQLKNSLDYRYQVTEAERKACIEALESVLMQ